MKFILFVVLAALSFTGSYNGVKYYRLRNNVLGVSNTALEIVEVTQTPTPFPTNTPVPTKVPKPTIIPMPTVIPTPTSLPQPLVDQGEIHGFIERFAGQYGVDPNVIRHIATCESGFRQTSVNGIYVGLFQFSPTSWKTYRNLMGEDPDISLRTNAEEAVQTAAFVLSIGKGKIWPNCMP